MGLFFFICQHGLCQTIPSFCQGSVAAEINEQNPAHTGANPAGEKINSLYNTPSMLKVGMWHCFDKVGDRVFKWLSFRVSDDSDDFGSFL